MKKCYIIVMILVLMFSNTAFAAESPPDVVAETAILGEASTGKIIYEKDKDKKMYPASMTKLLTAIVALEHLNPDDIVTVGSEINEIPADSSKAGHTRGESLNVKNLIRGLLIPSGNDSANVLAVAVARKVENNEELPFEECVKVFTDLMNQKAKALGAENSHFANAHGYHDENHYTTAQDMLLIAQEALKNDTITEIAKEKEYIGSGLEEQNNTLKTKSYRWANHNLLVTDNEYQYEYAIGLKTGFMDEAGDCLTAAAQKDGTTLIAVVCNSEDPGRWTDTKALFEYGFNNYTMVNLQKSGDVVDTTALKGHNRLLGDTLDVVIKEDVSEYMLTEDAERVVKSIEYLSDFKVESKKESKKEKQNEENNEQQNSEQQQTQLQAPISKDTQIGTITYQLDNEVLKQSNIYASQEVEKSTIMSTIKYFFQNLNLISFKTIAAIAVIAAVIAVLAVLIGMIKARRNRRRYKYTFQKSRRRYNTKNTRNTRSKSSRNSRNNNVYRMPENRSSENRNLENRNPEIRNLEIRNPENRNPEHPPEGPRMRRRNRR